MDKSPSINCQEVDNGSWDLDENEDDDDPNNNNRNNRANIKDEDGEAVRLGSLDNLSSNSWDSSSDKDGKPSPDDRETAVEAFTVGEDQREPSPLDSWRSSGKILKAQERPPPISLSGSSSSDSLGVPLPVDDPIQAFLDSPIFAGSKPNLDRLPARHDDHLIIEDIKPMDSPDLATVVEECSLDENDEPEEDHFPSGEKLFRRKSELVVEDLEEPQEAIPSPVSNTSDEEVWRIPTSRRTDSTDDADSARALLRNMKSGRLRTGRKTRSDPNVVLAESTTRKRSKSVDDLVPGVAVSLKDILIQVEGSSLRIGAGKKKDEVPGCIIDVTNLGDRPNHYQEIECRTLRTVVGNVKKEATEVSESDDAKNESGSSADNCSRNAGSSRAHPGTSSKVSEEAVSLPDIAGAGRSDVKADREFRKAVSYTTNHNLVREAASEPMENKLTESWILLDEMGQSQPVTLLEVNFLLNGRSADAVLQENKEHFIPKSTVVRNANSDFLVDQWNPLVEESLQHFFNEEDIAGEDTASKTIGLERKFGNMLLYIQSGVNLTSSVRFIPVDTEMIQMWRQSKENVSPISSEDDAHVAASENITEETSEYDNQETSDDVRSRTKDSFRSNPVVRKRRNRMSKADECEHRIVENRRIIESLTDDIKQLRMRLDAERSRSSSLEQEIYRLRGQLDKCKSGHSGADSHKKSEITEEYKKPTNRSGTGYVPEISSSSILSIDELRQDHETKASTTNEKVKSSKPDVQGTVLPARDDQKNFKEALDKNLNDIEEILKCKNRFQTKGGGKSKQEAKQMVEDNSRISSSVSVNTYAVLETSSQVLSEATGSVDSWFKLKLKDNSQKNVADVINELEKENEDLVMENLNLKKKLNEISIELDEYSSACMVKSPTDEGRQSETLRNQVCTLKLELDNLKSLAKSKEQGYKVKDAILREEIAEKTVLLEEWRTSILDIFREMDNSKEKLQELGLSPTPALTSEVAQLTPGDFLSHLRSFLSHLTLKAIAVHNENSTLKATLRDTLTRPDKAQNLNRTFDFGYVCGISSFDRSEYEAFQSEKASLEEEVNSLRKENDLLLEYQMEHNDKFRKTVHALREEKTRSEAMEKALRLLEMEKSEFSQAMISYQKEKTIAESELVLEKTRAAELRAECDKKKKEVQELEAKVEEVTAKFRNFDENALLKDEIINELKDRYEQMESRESYHGQQIQFLTEQLKKLESEKADLEEELQSSKEIAQETAKGMSEYISHLESMVSNADDSISDIKTKYNETCKALTALKKTHEDLEGQNMANANMYALAKEDLDECRRTLRDMEENGKRCEEAKRKALSDLNTIVKSEREKTEALEKMIQERKTLDEELFTWKKKAESSAKTKDRLMKEQKDLMNEMSMLKKENDRLSQKYRGIKSECNERTRLLKRLDGKLKANFIEYNKRLACLEKNVSNILEKAAAYKDCFLERRTEMHAVVRELRNQLDTVNMEKKEVQTAASNFYAAMRRLQDDQRKTKRFNSYMDCNQVQNKCDGAQTTLEDSSEASFSKNDMDELEKRVKAAETVVTDAQEKIRQLETSKEEDRNKYESIISDLKTQIGRYQLRLEVMLKNISACGKNAQAPFLEKREGDDGSRVVFLEQKVRDLTEELEKKRKRMLELTQVIEGNEVEIKKKGEECDGLKDKVGHLKDEIKNMRNQFAKLQEFLTSVNKNVETYQKERDEVSEKLAKSLKVIVEERASKQSSEAVFTEKEKMLKDQLDELKTRLAEKKKDYETLLKSMEDKKGTITKLQEDVKKWKSEVGVLKNQITTLKEQKAVDYSDELTEGGNKLKCILSVTELKELRATNLELRKKEGTLQSTIVRLEDELRGARLLIKELEGDLRAEKISKKLIKDMIASAKNEIERFKRGGQLMTSIADKIERHFNLSEVQSRELFSGYRATCDDHKYVTTLR